MKKILALLLAALCLCLAACASDSASDAPDNVMAAPATPVPTVFLPQLTPGYAEDAVPLEELMADFATKIQAGSAGSSLKAVGQAVRLMDWGVSTVMSEEEIFMAVDSFLSGLDESAHAEYLTQIRLLDESYLTLLTSGQELLLETAGCADTAYPWSDSPIPAVESFMKACGVRNTPNLFLGTAQVEDPYSPLLKSYYLAFLEGWDADTVMEAGLNHILVMEFAPYSPFSSLGYARHDINGDGVLELIIGDTNEAGTVYGIYTQQDGQPVEVFSGWNRNKAFICTDGTVVVRGSGGAAITYYSYYKLEGGALKVFGSIIHEGNASPDAPWFIGYDDDKDITNDSHATEEQAMGLIQQFEAMYIPFSLAPLSTAGDF